MGYVSWFYVESKMFELSVPDGAFVLQLVGRRHGLSCAMLVGKFIMELLKKSIEKLVRLPEDS